MSRILYIATDSERPSGGMRVLFRHVEILCRAGFNAAIVRPRPGVAVNWFSSSAPVLYASKELGLSADDWVVIPEDYPGAIVALSRLQCRRAVFCQNHYYIFNGIAPRRSWSDFGISEVLVSSQTIRDFVARVFGIAPTHIPLSLDHSIFCSADVQRKLQVALMPRKGAYHIPFIKGILHHLAPDLDDFAWVEIDGKNEHEVADILQQSAFFLSTSNREGFGLPPIEAMACGALVVGFKGGGGQEYATATNGFWVADEDAVAMSDCLRDLMRSYRQAPDDPRWQSVREVGIATASRYSAEREESALIAFWNSRAPAARHREVGCA